MRRVLITVASQTSLFIVLILTSLLFSQNVFADSTQCQQISVPVSLSPLGESHYQISGSLCWQGTISNKTVQLLIHGYTYDHTYWDFPYQEPNYSYVTSAVNAGYITFAIDRIGVGQSSHPDPELITLQSNAYVIHELVQDLRSGKIGGTSFSKIVLVGHSLGTLISWQEAASYQDIDGVIASGWLHAFNPLGAANVITATYPADLDPKFADSGLPIGYVTTKPGTRGPTFYNILDTDPQVIALDEILKQTGTDGELATFTTGIDPLITLSIHVPVLSSVGQNDNLFCGLLLHCASEQDLITRENTFYTSHACLEGYVLPNSGHDINLHINASTWYDAANNWIARRIGISPTKPPTESCQ